MKIIENTFESVLQELQEYNQGKRKLPMGRKWEIIDSSHFTDEQRGQLKLLSNINCTHCKNCWFCTNCFNCKDCRNCRDCRNCIRGYNCLDCIRCYRCINCKHCIECRNCENCQEMKNACDMKILKAETTNLSTIIRL